MKEKEQFEPFQPVLVRRHEYEKWKCDIFSHKDGDYFCGVGGSSWNYCIPYHGNESLLRTTYGQGNQIEPKPKQEIKLQDDETDKLIETSKNFLLNEDIKDVSGNLIIFDLILKLKQIISERDWILKIQF